MVKKYLIVNTGSVSAKYSIYSELTELFFGHFEIEKGKSIVTFFDTGRTGAGRKENITEETFNNSLEYFIEEAVKKEIIADKTDISSIGVRIVAPGAYFQEDRIIDSFFLDNITEAEKEAPLHISVTLKEINKLREAFKSTPIVGISDSAYHKDVPDSVKYYAIPKKVSDEYEIYHFGYHGISVGSIVAKLGKDKRLPGKIIICHLGGGSSVVAIKDGKSFNTSMGYSPLEGVVMASRAGDIDPVAVIHLGKKLNKSNSELETYFNEECGLLGLSGTSSDIRDLLVSESKSDKDAKLALEKLVMSIKKYIGAYSAQMGGLDMLIFSGTIGERSFIMRDRILTGLEYLGIHFDKKLNDKSEGVNVEISTTDSKVKVQVVLTDEMEDMAERLRKVRVLKWTKYEKNRPYLGK